MASDPSPSTTPILTPDSTGTSGSSPDSVARKSRRQTAFYPNVNSSNKPVKPFSRSAAKRESVMALGSIEHLQHYFTKTGIAAKKKACYTVKGTTYRTSVEGDQDDDEELFESDWNTLSSCFGSPYPRAFCLENEKCLDLPEVILRTLGLTGRVLGHWVHAGSVISMLSTILICLYTRAQSMMLIIPFHSPLNKPYQGLVPAIGGLTHVRTSSSIGSRFELPPSPAIPPPQPEFIQHVKTYDVDPDSLLPGVIDDLAAVAQAWRIDTQPNDDDPSRTFNVLSVLKITTRTIRSIRNYLFSLGDESASTIRAHFRPKLLGPGGKPQSIATSSSIQPDPLSLIRKSALEVLTVLRELEERCRLPLSDDAYDAHSDGGSRGTHSQVASPANNSDELPPEDDSREIGAHLEADNSFTFSVVQVKGKFVPVWEDDDDEFEQSDGEKEKPEPWDERLVVGSGWLYRQDVEIEELEKERNVIAAYLDVVDEVLFEWKRNEEVQERGWEKERRKVIEKGDRIVSKAKARRVSSGDSREISAAGNLLANGGKRRVSTGMLDSFSGMTLSEEPEALPEEEEE
ncbi:hypothetical protein C0995_012844 [Termitomyces sp. Mi166|nr:hypothetical protein C0995_012844 [Termitomyces sp. Mi166\